MRLDRVAALSCCVCIACDNPVGPSRPQGQGELVPVNQLIEDVISGAVVRRYSFEVTLGGEYVVLLKSLHGFVGLSVQDPATQYTLATIGSAPGPTALEDNASSNVPTSQAGVLLLEAQVFNGDTARFQFKIVPVHTPPEIVPNQFTIGDTIIGETIEPRYDTDIFTAHADAGQIIAAALQPLGSDPGGITLYVETADGQFVASVPAGVEPLMSTGAISVSTSQDYRFVIRSGGIGSVRYRGPYRVWSYLINPAPEHVATPLAPDAVVTGERIDQPNDIDQFTLVDTVGAEFLAFLQASRHFFVQVRAPGGTLIGPGVAMQVDADTTLLHHALGSIRLDSTGTYSVRVFGGFPGEWLMADTGAYRFLMLRLDRRPESAASAVQVGDTVTGEEIYPAGDIDEFTLSATPSAQLKPWFRLTATPVPSYAAVVFEAVDPGTGAVLSQGPVTATGGFTQGTTFTVPASGAVRLRFGGAGGPRAPFAFTIQP
jgi:hypothetical protein